MSRMKPLDETMILHPLPPFAMREIGKAHGALSAAREALLEGQGGIAGAKLIEAEVALEMVMMDQRHALARDVEHKRRKLELAEARHAEATKSETTEEEAAA